MADITVNIDEARQVVGRMILALTDSVGFDAFAAGWLCNQPADTWRYFLVTPMLRSRGPTWIYERLMRLFRHDPLPAGFSPLDIHVIDPEMERALFGPPDVANPNAHGLNGLPSHDLRPEHRVIEDGFVMFQRRLPAELRRHRRDPGAQFNKQINQLQAA